MRISVDTDDLKIGMYVSELDRPWSETPFRFQGFVINTDEELAILRQYCRTVFVIASDTYKLAEVKHPSVHKSTDIRQRSLKIISVEQKMPEHNNHPVARSVCSDKTTTLEEEIQNVKDIHTSASDMVQELMWEAKFGRTLNIPGARRLISQLAGSVMRNPDALTCFAQLKNKDEYTAQHSLRVSILSLVFGRQLHLTRTELETLGLGAMLLDIGKMKIPSEILNKPAPLIGDELALMRQHVPWGFEILEKSKQIPAMALHVVLRHHERYDGSGYGGNLKGDDIGKFGLIAGILDYYDAITSDRVYRSGISTYAALKKMDGERGTLFHPRLTRKFIQCLGIYPIGSVVELNTGEIAVVMGHDNADRQNPRLVLVQGADKKTCPGTPAVSLINRKTSDGRPCEIVRVLEPEEGYIEPARYILPKSL